MTFIRLPPGVKIALPFALALIGLVSLGALSYRRFAEQLEGQQRVDHTLRVLDALEELQSLLRDVQRGANGYVLGGDSEFLEVYERAALRLPLELEKLRGLTVDNPVQKQRVRYMGSLIADEINAAEELIATTDEQFKIPNRDLADRKLRSIVNRLELAVVEMRRAEETSLKQHQATSTSQARILARLIVAFAALAVFVIAAVALALWRDFSARRRFEAALAESAARNRAILNSALDAIVTVDENGNIESLNPAAERMFGYPAAEVVGKNPMLLTPEISWEERAKQRRVSSGAGAGDVGSASQVATGMRKDGTGFPVEFSVAEIKLDGARRFTAIVRDISRRVRIEQSLQEASAKLARSNRDLEHFAAVASHDLQEPLRKIQIFGERLLQICAGSLEPQAGDYLKRMVDAAGRMRTLINDLLELARVSVKSVPAAPVDLGQVARDLMGDIEIELVQSGGRIEMGFLPTVEADALQMRQLLQNLIGNALKYRRGDEPPLIRIESCYLTAAGESSEIGPSVGGSCRITIEDNGIGFDEKYADRIFKPFQRLHGRDHYEGSGIGLAICRQIVERHGGTITARSVPGQGSTFIVELPLKARLDKTAYGQAA